MILPNCNHKSTAVWLHPLDVNTQTIHVRHDSHCWESKDKLISYVLLWTTTYEHTIKTFIYKISKVIGIRLEILPRVMTEKNGERQSRESIQLIHR